MRSETRDANCADYVCYDLLIQKTFVCESQTALASLVTSSSALPDGCQPRPDAALKEPVQLRLCPAQPGVVRGFRLSTY